LVKTERIQVNEAQPAPGSAWLIAAAAWFIPGLGHVLLERWYRAALMGGAAWLCFFLGMMMGGHMYDLSSGDGSSSTLLQVPPMIANMGSGVLSIIFWMLGIGFADDPQQAARASYEYGNTFLLIAGLLNYLIMLDAFDIAAGRKS
jgi:hypothetical protein